MSFSEAASIPLAAITALQAFNQYKGSLDGKTVFVPAGRERSFLVAISYWYANNLTVSGTGAYACQLAKNVFKAAKVITTVSTSKVPKVPELLGETVVDQSKQSLITPSAMFRQANTCSSHRLHKRRSPQSHPRSIN